MPRFIHDVFGTDDDPSTNDFILLVFPSSICECVVYKLLLRCLISLFFGTLLGSVRKTQRNKIPSDETSNVPLIEKRFPSIFSTFCMSRPFSSVVVGGNRISLWNCIRDRAFNYFINTDSAAIYCQIVCRENGRAFEYLQGDRSGYGRIITCLCYIVSYCCRFRMVSSSVRLFPTYGCNIAVSFLCFATFETFFLVIFVVGSGVWGRLAVVGVRKRGLPDEGE